MKPKQVPVLSGRPTWFCQYFDKKLAIFATMMVVLLSFLACLPLRAQTGDSDPNAGLNDGYPSVSTIDSRVASLSDLKMKLVRMGMNDVGGNTVGASFNFADRDIMVNKYLNAGITIHSVVSARGHVSRGANYDEWKANYRNFCSTVMTRYKDKIKYYIVDNEPDLSDGGPMTAQQAVDMTRIAYEEAKKVSSGIMVESAPVSGVDVDYLKTMISLGVTQYCDFLGVHIYGGQIDDGRGVRPWQYMDQYPSFPRKPVAASECGTADSYHSSCSDPGASRALWYASFNVQFKRFGFSNVLLFDLQDHGEWNIVGRPVYDRVKATYDDKVLTNGGFENATDLLNANEWMKIRNTYDGTAVSCTNEFPGNIYIQSSGARSGTKCLQIDGDGRIRQIHGKVTPGTTVTIEAYVNITGGTAYLRAQGFNKTDGDEERTASTTATGWQKLTLTVTPSNPWVVVELSHNGTGNAKFDDVAASGGTATCSLPSGWSSQDIGTVGATGSACESSGTYTLKGAGADIYGTADGFRFAYRTLSGDGEMVARVGTVQNTNDWAKAGVMIRESLTAGSKYMGIFQRPNNEVVGQWRTTASGSTSGTASSGGTTGTKWIRVKRTGSTFSVFYSTASATGPWTQLGANQTISMASSVYIGLALTSHVCGTLNTTAFTNVSVTGTGSVNNTYEAEASSNTLADGAQAQPTKVNWMGSVQFNSVSVPSAGTYTLYITYMNGGSARNLDVIVNGSSTGAISCPATANWETVNTVSKSITLNSGTNTIKLYGNPGPDVDKIRVSNTGSRMAFSGAESLSLQVYPNPATHQVTVVTPEEASVSLVGTKGETVGKGKTTGKRITFRTDQLSRGFYIIKVTGNRGVTTTKLLLE